MSLNETHQASITIKVPFYDVDSMDVVWHGHYVKYLEEARCALLEQLGYGYTQMRASGYVWPIVKMQFKYIRPAFFNQELTVSAFLYEYENGLGIKYKITDKQTGELLTKAETMQFAIDMKTKETCYLSPEIFRNKIKK